MGSILGWVFVALLAVGVGGGIGFGIATIKYAKALESYKASQLLNQALLNDLEGIAARMKAGVSDHTSRVEEIQRDLEKPDTPDGQRVQQAASELAAANERLQSELAIAKKELDDQSQKLRKQQHEARTDPLTMLPNRRSFDDALQNLAKKSVPGPECGALLMLDVDHFKQFNDRYGHQVGDKVLKHVARTLRQSILGSDATAARYGGEEFAIILPVAKVSGDQRLSTAKELANQIRAAVEKATFLNDGEPLGVRVSIGLTAAIAGITGEQLIARADEALYAAKKAGRNRCYYHSGSACLPVEGPVAAQAEPAATQASPSLEKPPLIAAAPVRTAPVAAPEVPVPAAQVQTAQPIQTPRQPVSEHPATTPAGAGVPQPEPAAPSAKEKPGRERRKHDRVRCNGVHLVAPCADDRIPPIDKFFRVQFFDISSSGFAMILPAAPTTDRFAVALKKPSGLVFMGAEVMNVRQTEEVTVNGKAMTVVGCKFTQRLTNPAESPRSMQSASTT
jgi:diguanylate cyclase (GGDEF)-like protein